MPSQPRPFQGRVNVDYVSTRGEAPSLGFSDALLAGLARDGGLYVPREWPAFSKKEIRALRGKSYEEIAFTVLTPFVEGDIPADKFRAMIDEAYATFRHPAVAPLVQTGPNSFVMELFHGTTLAFKDVAMQLLARLMDHALAARNERATIVGATSGDTGSAAEYAMRGKKNIRVFMLSPHGKMSPFQKAQMYSLQDENIHNIAIKGVFDDAQDIVKAVSNDLAFKQRYNIGTVNSINWARLIAQVVYYFKGYFAATKSDDEQVSFAVPSGNFGNICAGHVARMMGLPIKKLIAATNENDVLDEFFRTGIYRVRKGKDVFETSSPSMDISKASNFERFVFDLMGRDPNKVAALWKQIDGEGAFDLAKTGDFARVKDFGFVSGRSTHEDRLNTIRMADRDYKTTIDTHTADGLKVGLTHREQGVPLICLETALPAKFEKTIQEALGRPPKRPLGYENIEALPQRCEVMDADVSAVKQLIEKHAA